MGTVQDALAIQWSALQVAYTEMLVAQEMGNAGGALSGVHAVNQAGAGFAKMLESADLQAQLDEVKEELRELKQAQGLRKVV